MAPAPFGHHISRHARPGVSATEVYNASLMSHPDEYTEKYMEGGRSLATSRMRMPGWFFALMAIITLISSTSSIAATVASGSPAALIPLLFTVPLLAAITLLFSHLRATVTATHLIVQYGLFGPTIPLDRIESVNVEKYEMMSYGGWGIKRSRAGVTAYSVPGGSGDCVRIDYRDEHGKVHKLAVTVEDSAAFVRSIQQSRGGVVRVDATSEPAHSAQSVENSVVESPAVKRGDDVR